MNKNFDKLPMRWVERIFERMECLYKSKWISHIGNENRQSILKNMWSTGLSGLTVEEIKKALTMCECFPHSAIPTVIEFYHYAKGSRVMTGTKLSKAYMYHPANKVLARSHLDEIKQALK